MPTELLPLQREALAWVVRLHSGAATTHDADALGDWRRRSPEHEIAFRDAVTLWRVLGEATRELVNVTEATMTPAARRSAWDGARVNRRWLVGGALAASAAGYMVAGSHIGLLPSMEELSADYRTAKGERRTLTIADGVSLQLNTQTSVARLPSSSAPQVKLVSGEAVFTAEEAHEARVIVIAGDGRISASGASFSGRSLDGDVLVCCLDGAIEIDCNGRRTRLAAGRQISYAAGVFGEPAPADDAATAWRDGLLIVRDWPLTRVASEINRYRPGKIVVMDSRLGRRMISGTFYLERLDDFIGQARGLFGAAVVSLPGGVVLLS